MDGSKQTLIDSLLCRMTLEQKIGQCLVLGYAGAMITPEILKRIRRYKPAGIRAGLVWRIRTVAHDPGGTDPRFAQKLLRPFKGTMKDFVRNLPVPHCTNEEYCGFLNTLKEAAMHNDPAVPLHITFDMEGDISADYYRGGVHYFPSCLGIAQTGDPRLAYEVAWAVGRQLAPLGFGWIHSPVLDVNTNPLNPEIGTRSYGDDPAKVAEYAVQALRGYRDSGLISTGKHFPGRGESLSDAHHGLPVSGLSKMELQKHIEPYRALIAEGLPAIMSAHTAYPALDPSGLPATLSKPILTHLLKEELGFQGVVTSDEMTMGGIIQSHDVPEACIRALDAGCDLLLLRDEGALIDEVFPALVNAVREGRLPEERVEEAVRRTLSVKNDYGFFKGSGLRDPDRASEGILDAKVAGIAEESARRSLMVLRDEQGILPLAKERKVLLVQQVNPLHERTNTSHCHPAILWEKFLEHTENVSVVETHLRFTEEDKERVRQRLGDAEVIVATNYYDRSQPMNGNVFLEELHKTGKPVVVVTNSPFPSTVLTGYKTVIVTYGSSPESMAETARRVFQGG